MNETPEASAHTALWLWRRFLAAPTHRHLQSRSKPLGRFAASLPTSQKMKPKLNDDQFDAFREIPQASQRDSKNSSGAKAGTFKWGFSFASSVPVSFCSHLVFHTRKHCVSSQLGCVTAVASDPEVWIIVSITLPTACHNTQKKAVKSRSPADTFLWFTTLDWANVEKLKHEEETKKLKLCSLAGTSGPHRGVRKSRETF